MKKLISFVFAIGILATVSAQKYDSIAVKYANTITDKDLSKHLHIIASDEYEGRETGKKGQKMAMNYLIKEFKSYGIEAYNGESYIQSFDLIEQSSSGIELSLGVNKFIVNKDFTFSPTVSNNKVINGEMIFVGYGIEEDNYNSYENLDVKGKAVFILNDLPKKVELKNSWKIKDRIKLAEEKGAVAVIYCVENLDIMIQKYEHYFSKPKMELKDDVIDETPILKITKQMAETLFESEKLDYNKIIKKGLKKNKTFSVNYELTINKPTSLLTSENVLAYIPGTSHKEEVLVLSAHYDHIGKDDSLVFNGADDDGTGTVTLIEIAQAFMQAKKEGHSMKRSILILAVSGEEKGLLGSKYYTDNPIFPLKNTVVNLNIDMIGRYDEMHKNDSNYIYLIGSDKLSSELHDLSENVNKLYINTQFDYTFNDENDPNRFYYRSDHYNFAKNDIPVIFYFSGVHEDYHKATDTVEKIDFKKTQKIARLVFYTAWEIANREERIKVDKKE